MGLNTQDSSVDLSSGYATVANNCVIDKFGRIGARKGWITQHAVAAAVTGHYIEFIDELVDTDGTNYVIIGANNKLFRLASNALTELTYGGGGSAPTITANNWKAAPLSGALWLYQAGHAPLIYDPGNSTTTYRRISEVPGYAGTVQQSNIVISAYGRTWSANTATDKTTIQWSDILAGQVFTGGTSGSLDVTRVWPAGGDVVVALAAHNNFLYVFGKRQILVYQGAEDPATMSLADTISGVGCVARDSVVTTGTDIIFLSDSGVRSLQRTIQEKSAPMRDISANIRDDLVVTVELANKEQIRAVYSDKEAFYLLSLPSVDSVFCFDTRTMLQNGANRATTWSGITPRALKYTSNRDLLLGEFSYVGKYDGYRDNGETYTMSYTTSYFDMQQPTQIKIAKKIGITTIGGAGYIVNLKHGFDFSDIYRYRQFTLGGTPPSYYNIDEYNIAEFGGSVFNNRVVNIGGTGRTMQIGFDIIVNNQPVSIQKIDMYVKIGKLD
jgi:hypothetical protein